jgi:glycosidase
MRIMTSRFNHTTAVAATSARLAWRASLAALALLVIGLNACTTSTPPINTANTANTATITPMTQASTAKDLSKYQPQAQMRVKHPSWAKHATIYQINTRQFTPEGTFKAAQAHLPRLKALGIDIVWLMPIHPIGEKNRKGTLGSPYAVKDYLGVNPEFGTLADLKAFVHTAHSMGMYVILDWVANHTAWDNPLATQHPEWYARDWKGDFRPTPWWDWSDIIDLNYDQPGLRQYMTEALTYWVREAGVDGYRCDVAGFVPLDFWATARRELDAIKPVFMLAEWEARDLHTDAFDATYAWSWGDAIHSISQGKADVGALFRYYSWNEGAYPRDIYRMKGVSNHDLNAWDGTQSERYGDALHAAIVLSVLGEGIPMIYNSQEVGEPKRLEFFEKDAIKWPADMKHPVGELYASLFALKHKLGILANGAAGASMVNAVNTAPMQVFSYVRQNDKEKLLVVMNLSKAPQTIGFKETLPFGEYTEHFTQAKQRVDASTQLTLKPWEYRAYLK